MVNMKGFRMIRVDTGRSIYTCENGQVEYIPKIKYRIEKKNAFDPSIVHQREPYREDTINLEAVLYPEEYSAFLYFLTQPGKFYVEFQWYSIIVRQYPVIITQLPKMPDDLHEYPEKVKVCLEARYVGEPGFINFDYYTTLDDQEMVY